MSQIPVACPSLNGKEAEYVRRCIDTGWISSIGEFITRFEVEYASFAGTNHALACANGTVALHLALASLGIGAGDEVIVPDFTYIASANAVRYCGADVVLADVDPLTLTIDPESVRKLITERTKAIVAVDLYGTPANYPALRDVIGGREISIVEDAAEAHGALLNGRPVGALGDIATFSFFGNKILTTGEGGMVTTDNDELYQRCKLLRGQGMDFKRRYWFPVVGYNYRMTNIAAAIGCAQLEQIGEELAKRDAIAKWYQAGLADCAHLIRTPVPLPDAVSVNWMYTIILRGFDEQRRDELIVRMSQSGVETRPTFIPLHRMPPYAGPDEGLEVSTIAGTTGISLPTYGALSEPDVERVCETLKAVLGQRQKVTTA